LAGWAGISSGPEPQGAAAVVLDAAAARPRPVVEAVGPASLLAVAPDERPPPAAPDGVVAAQPSAVAVEPRGVAAVQAQGVPTSAGAAAERRRAAVRASFAAGLPAVGVPVVPA
jgi:hypothetical protein